MSCVPSFVRRVLWYTQLDQVMYLRLWQFPLLPDTHADPSVQPSIEIIDRGFHARDPIVVHPPSAIDLDLFKTWSDALTPSTGRVFAQLIFELLHRLWMNADIDALPVLPQRKAEILKISDSKHADNAAFLLIHLQFQSSLKILRARLQKSLCGSFALRQQDDVVCIADARNSPFQVLLIELIEVDVRQQRGKVSSLCRVLCYVELSAIILAI